MTPVAVGCDPAVECSAQRLAASPDRTGETFTMALPPDPSTGRVGTRILALLLAVIFLAVIGGSAGYILGLRHKHAARVQNRADNRPAVTDSGSPAGRDPDGGPSRTRGAGPTGKRCLDETERDAKAKFGSPGGLAQVFYLKTDRSEVWICRDTDNALFYQGHVRSAAEQQGGARPPLRDLQNSLLLKTVRPDGAGWLAENDSGGGAVTRYRVSADELVIEQPKQNPDHQKAIAHDP
jgi:hypothetical protein